VGVVPLAEPGNTFPAVLRKISVTVLMGAISFPFTQLLFSDLAGQIAAAGVFGSVVLMIQFLIEFERRLGGVERGLGDSVANIRELVRQGFAKVNDATQLVAQVETAGLNTGVSRLVRHAAGISPEAPPLVRAFVQLEVNRVSELLRGLTVNEATYEGEDQDWLLNLTRCAAHTIDAVSIPEVDAAGNTYHSFWQSHLGRRYMDLQRQATRRGVHVRRVFVTERDEMAGDQVLQRICRAQDDSGIEVRLLSPSAVPDEIRGHITDYIVFDDTLSYETTPLPHVDRGDVPMILSSRLELRADKVLDRVVRYTNIWEAATPWSEVPSAERVLSAVPDES
jgi:hypothetical protein